MRVDAGEKVDFLTTVLALGRFDRLSDLRAQLISDLDADANPRHREPTYSPVSNIGDIWSLEEGADESSIVLDIDKVGLDAFLQQFV